MYPLRIRLATPPSGLALSLQDAKGHLRVDADTEDAQIEAYIKSAADYFSRYTSHQVPLLEAGYVASYGGWNTALDGLPQGVTVTGVSYQPADLSESRVSLVTVDDYAALPAGDGVYLKTTARPALSFFESVEPVAVAYTAGVTDAADLSDDLKRVLRMLVQHQYDNRQVLAFSSVSEAPATLTPALDFYRTPSL